MAVGEFVSMTQKAEIEKARGVEDDGEVSDPWTAALTSWVCYSTCTAPCQVKARGLLHEDKT
jgi:hypothetical protein